MNQQDFWKWIESLNPIVVDVDQDGNLNPLDLEKLDKRIEDAVSEVRNQQPVNPPEQAND